MKTAPGHEVAIGRIAGLSPGPVRETTIRTDPNQEETMKETRDIHQKRFKVLPEMEGAAARWYARGRGSRRQIEQYREQVRQLTGGLPDGADVLEVAPGPGYLTVELARLGRFRVAAVDVSRTFVEIAGEYARRSAVTVDFRHGDVHDLPFDAGSFDLILCQAAFKNFGRPVRALDEMHRVLRPGATAVIQDLSREASRADIGDEVRRLDPGGFNAVVMGPALRMLRRRALSRTQFERLAAASAFGGCDIQTSGVNIEVRLTKRSGR
jgi:ubiquinone/menaquinone biosynthesis C-methylase UbiE